MSAILFVFRLPDSLLSSAFPLLALQTFWFFFSPRIFDMEHFKSLYWICYNIASILCFGFFGCKACGILVVPWPGFEPAPPACCCPVTQSCPTLCNPMDCNLPDFPVLHYYPEFAQTHVHWVSDAIQPFHPLKPPSPLVLSLSPHQVFSYESALCIRWPKYWSFSFSISPSNEYSGWKAKS